VERIAGINSTLKDAGMPFYPRLSGTEGNPPEPDAHKYLYAGRVQREEAGYRKEILEKETPEYKEAVKRIKKTIGVMQATTDFYVWGLIRKMIFLNGGKSCNGK